MKTIKKAIAVSALVMSANVMLVNPAQADVRVEITRDLPSERQIIVQLFNDKDEFEMWMSSRLEGEGCDPYVTSMSIDLDYIPEGGA